jgi:hypothetical protein
LSGFTPLLIRVRKSFGTTPVYASGRMKHESMTLSILAESKSASPQVSLLPVTRCTVANEEEGICIEVAEHVSTWRPSGNAVCSPVTDSGLGSLVPNTKIGTGTGLRVARGVDVSDENRTRVGLKNPRQTLYTLTYSIGEICSESRRSFQARFELLWLATPNTLPEQQCRRGSPPSSHSKFSCAFLAI